jgi:hypothetical protein
MDVDPVTTGAVRPVRHIVGVVAWRSLEPPSVDVDDLAVLVNVIFEHFPGQRMIALADAEEAPKGHHRMGTWPDIPGCAGVFAHLAVTFCRCMNLAARYRTGYLGGIGLPASN